MANWCDTTIKIFGEKEKLEKLSSLINEWLNNEEYLANIVENSGIGVISEADATKDKPYFFCRGYLITNEVVENEDVPYLHLKTQTTWNPAIDMFNALKDKYIGNDATLYFYGCEPMMGLCVTNDPSYEDSYVIEEYLKDEVGYYTELRRIEGRENLIAFLQKKTNLKTEDYDELEEEFIKKRLGTINEWEVIC